jgi:molybdopterin-guanine dinucleotide biosynthesis protein B
MNRVYKKQAIAFTGPSNSGKTTLILNLSVYLQKEGYKVAIIKHDPKDKASFDKKGKDSYLFNQTGADVIVASPTRTTMFKQAKSNLDEMVVYLDKFDYLLVEGLKIVPLPRIYVCRDILDKSYLSASDAIAITSNVDVIKQKNIDILPLDDLENIKLWIDFNCKKYI